MKVGKMILVTASSMFSLLCQACAGVPAQASAQTEPVQPSDAMRLAAPPNFGNETATAPATMTHVSPGTLPFSGTPVQITTSVTTDLTESDTAAPDYSEMATAELRTSQRIDWSSSEAVATLLGQREQQKIESPMLADRNLVAEFTIDAPAESTGLDFDVGVTPRLKLTEDGDLNSRRLGGEVRVGQGLSRLAREGKTPEGWYIFAGADGEALVWDAGPGNLAPDFSDMSVREQVTVGDLQAGISVQRGGGQLSLSYIRREVKYDDRNRSMEENEDFAGISFTMKR